MQMEESPSN